MKLETIKPRIGIFGLTGCAGCQLTILFREEILDIAQKADIVSFPFGKGKNDSGSLDIVFIEGLIVNDKDIEMAKKLRDRSKIVVAMGACAVHACTPGIKNFVNKKIENIVYAKTSHLGSIDPSPIDKFIKVDHYIKGCPVDREEVLFFIKQFLLGKKPVVFEKSLCYTCNLRENYCLLDQGRECMGPLIDGNCSIMCPTHNIGCTGCRGPIHDSNIEAWLHLMVEKGYDISLLHQRLNKYAGLKFEEYLKEQGLIEEDLHDERKKSMIEALKTIRDMQTPKKTSKAKKLVLSSVAKKELKKKPTLKRKK